MNRHCYRCIAIMRCTAILLFFVCSIGVQAQSIRLTKLAEYTMNPVPSGHKTVSFPRLFFHEGRGKIYALYTGIKTAATGRSPQDQSIGWLEYDSSFVPTGKAGVLSEPTTGGDIAVAFDGANYYLLIGGPGGYLLYKYNADFALTQKVSIKLNTFDSPNDQLLNYTGGKLYFASIAGDAASMNNPDAPVAQRWFVYSTNLVQELDTVMKGESYIATGGSIISIDKTLHVVTADKFSRSALYVYQYSDAFKYIGKKLLASDGQWSQGLLYDNGVYYVAYHTGAHGAGNVAVGVFDKNWASIVSQAVTTYSFMQGKSGSNAQRPWIMKRGNLLYVAYDVATYNEMVQESPDWQGKVTVYTISTAPTSIRALSEPSIGNVSVYPHPPIAEHVSVRYSLAKTEYIRITVTDVLGREVLSVFEGTHAMGTHENSFSTETLAQGLYFLRLQTYSFSQTKPLQVLR